MNICKYCNSNFKKVSSLNYHQKNVRYCLIKQGKIEDIQIEDNQIIIYKCNFCDKILSTKHTFNSHLLICKNKQNKESLQLLSNEHIKISEYKEQITEYKEQITEYKEQIKELQNKIERMATKAIEKHTTNTTNLFLNPIDLSQEHITKMIHEKFTKEHFYDGQAGVARFAVDNILKDKDGKLGYICTDPSRQIFKHINSDGSVKKDVRASKLTKKLVKDVKQVSSQIVLKKMDEEKDLKENCNEFLTKKMEEIVIIDDDNSKFRTELANLTSEN